MNKLVFVLLCAPLWLGCGGGPCQVCPNIAGNYLESKAASPLGESSCDIIYWDAFTAPLAVTQQGSKVTVYRQDRTLTGTLNDDQSLQLDEYSGVARDPTGRLADIPVNFLLSGVITGSPGSYVFQGLYQVTAPSTGCAMRVSTRWAQGR